MLVLNQQSHLKNPTLIQSYAKMPEQVEKGFAGTKFSAFLDMRPDPLAKIDVVSCKRPIVRIGNDACAICTYYSKPDE